MNSIRVGSKALGRWSTRGALTLSVAAAALLAVASPANASDDCTPSDAWTETVAAAGEPTILVDNPDYVPAKPAKYRTVHHEAVTITTGTTYLRHTWKPQGQVPEGQTPDVTGSTPATHPDEWNANTSNYEGAGHGTDPLDQAFYVSSPGGQANGSWFYWQTFSENQTVPAWDEEVLVCAGTPAQGEPKIEQENPSYKPATTIEHPAVVCTATPGPSATTSTPTMTGTTLAATGTNVGTVALIAGTLALLGVAVTIVTRRRLAATRH